MGKVENPSRASNHSHIYVGRDRKHRSEQSRITLHSSLARRHGTQNIHTGTERLRGLGNRTETKARRVMERPWWLSICYGEE